MFFYLTYLAKFSSYRSIIDHLKINFNESRRINAWQVDLKKLENISTNRIAEELKETIAKKDVKYSRKLNEWDVS